MQIISMTPVQSLIQLIDFETHVPYNIFNNIIFFGTRVSHIVPQHIHVYSILLHSLVTSKLT